MKPQSFEIKLNGRDLISLGVANANVCPHPVRAWNERKSFTFILWEKTFHYLLVQLSDGLAMALATIMVQTELASYRRRLLKYMFMYIVVEGHFTARAFLLSNDAKIIHL